MQKMLKLAEFELQFEFSVYHERYSLAQKNSRISAAHKGKISAFNVCYYVLPRLTFLPQMISSTSITSTSGNKFHSVYFGLSNRFVGYWKMVSLPIVLLIFISSNYPQGKLNEGVLVPPTAQPEKGFADSGKSPDKVPQNQVNDLTRDFRFPDEYPKGKAATNKKIIREKVVPDEKDEKEKIPVPLYSLVKNDCGEGYALDENGVCQKTITVRSGKNFDSDRRRKRHILDYDWMTQRKKKTSPNAIKGDYWKLPVECGKLYPGMVSDGNGGCKKSVNILERPLDKTLPP